MFPRYWYSIQCSWINACTWVVTTIPRSLKYSMSNISANAQGKIYIQKYIFQSSIWISISSSLVYYHQQCSIRQSTTATHGWKRTFYRKYFIYVFMIHIFCKKYTIPHNSIDKVCPILYFHKSEKNNWPRDIK